MGHAKAILAFEHIDEQLAACRKIVSEGLSVRAAEKLTEKRKKKTVPVPVEKDVHVAAIEDELREVFGTRVNIVQRGDRGRVEIEYYNADDLERVIDLLRQRNLL
jgi:ParB family chromosome partitioning protein